MIRRTYDECAIIVPQAARPRSVLHAPMGKITIDRDRDQESREGVARKIDTDGVGETRYP